MNAVTRHLSVASNAITRFLFEHIVVVLMVLVVTATGVTFWYMSHLQDRLVAALAQQGAQLQSRTISEIRALYTSNVVERVRSHGIEVTPDYQKKDAAIPLPATFTIELGQQLGGSGTGLKVRLYSAYPFPWRKDGGPHDAFEREALDSLRLHPDQPLGRFDTYQGQYVYRYAVADRMLPQCISCHNSRPDSPKKDWKVGDVRGVLEVIRPVSALATASRQSLKQAFGSLSFVALSGLAAIGLVLGRQRRQARGLAEEIHERRRVEASLVESTARFSAMNEASPLGTFVTDPNGLCLRVNQMYQEITGYSDEAMRGKPWNFGIHPGDQARVLSLWSEMQNKNGNLTADCHFLRHDGSITWVSCKAAAMRNGEQLLGYVGTLEDISERKQVERMKNEFISTVSHELRTPLTSIMGSLGLLAGGVGGALSEQTKALVELASKNSERLVRLINDILDIEKIEAGHMQFDLKSHELQPLVEQAMAVNRAYAEQLGVTFKLTAPLPGIWVRVDADRLMQVMTNLMGNAAKFSPQGASVDLQITRHEGLIRVSVTDKGPGIPESFRHKVFEKFSQADASDTRPKGGTGLGLSISKAIMEAMGGGVGFDTQEGQGTTFHFDLPEWTETVPATLPEFPKAVSRLQRILVCEDDRDVSTLLCMMLEQAGYEAVPAYDGASVRRLLAEEDFAAMTLDVQMPGLDGRAFLHEMRADPALRDLCVVVVSGHLRKIPRLSKGEGDGLGVVDWIAKPIDQGRLINAVRSGIAGSTDGKSRVLHVEDDPDIRKIVASLCADIADFNSAATFQEATVLLSTSQYDLVVLDLSLPDRTGWDLIPYIEQLVPPPPVLVFSANELSVDESGRVAAAMVKSHVTNPQLLDAIQSLTRRI
ncbi:response regulator [Dyella choica]|uniref:histidine kinase n=1 Tax=Dyella choica TaxID=1927959 RepID=A0A432M553_9GAMM|nr:response regulator [Dyella choica]RUL74963.1 response regulator [Dyella choica]